MNQSKIDHGNVSFITTLITMAGTNKTALMESNFKMISTPQFKNDYSGNVTCGFVVQPLFIDHALKEIERCVNDLGLKVLCLPTHYINKKGEWLSDR